MSQFEKVNLTVGTWIGALSALAIIGGALATHMHLIRDDLKGDIESLDSKVVRNSNMIEGNSSRFDRLFRDIGRVEGQMELLLQKQNLGPGTYIFDPNHEPFFARIEYSSHEAIPTTDFGGFVEGYLSPVEFDFSDYMTFPIELSSSELNPDYVDLPIIGSAFFKVEADNHVKRLEGLKLVCAQGLGEAWENLSEHPLCLLEEAH